MSRRGNGEGSIFRRADGRWTGSVYVLLPSGGRSRRTVYGRTREDVAARVNGTLAEVAAGVPAPSEWTVARYTDFWLEQVAVESLRPSTQASYRWLLTKYIVPSIGSVRLGRLSPIDVRRMLTSMAAAGLSASSRVLGLAVLRSVLAEAMREQLVTRNVATLVRVRRDQVAEVRPWSPSEAATFLETASEDRLYALFAVGVALGLRRGELMGLRWEDIDLDARTLRVQRSLARLRSAGFVAGPPKSARSRRTLPMPTICVDALRAHRARQEAERLAAGPLWVDSGYVFTGPRGGPLDPSYLSKRFVALMESAGVRRIRLHDLRHTCASLLLAQRVPPRVVMEVLGHSQIGITMDLYSHVMPGALQDAADAAGRALGGS